MSRSESARSDYQTPPYHGGLVFEVPPDSALDPSLAGNGQRALLNILEDFAAEKASLEGGQRAMLNILDDFDAETAQMKEVQRAVLNILDDFEMERSKVKLTNQQLEAEIAERRRFERSLQEKNVELENANQAKDGFLASMSHELRTPLNAIIGFAGTLLMRLPGPLTGDQEKQLRTVQTSAKHLLSLINDLLDLAKVNSGKVQLNLEPVPAESVIQDVAATLRPLAEAKGLRFEVDLPAHTQAALTDRRALSQILINLANNAIKFTQKGRIRVSLTQHRSNGKLITEISVEDTGIGIRREDQEKLFQAFSRVNKESGFKVEGTGLGLHLSQKLAELLGGRIQAESEYGKGSRFTLLLGEKE